jgi:hypothetical protein
MSDAIDDNVAAKAVLTDEERLNARIDFIEHRRLTPLGWLAVVLAGRRCPALHGHRRSPVDRLAWHVAAASTPTALQPLGAT